MKIASFGSRIARIVRACAKLVLVLALLIFRWAYAADVVSQQTLQQIQALLAEKSSRTPAQQKMDSQLLQAVRESRGQPMAAGVSLAPANVGTDVSGKLEVDINARASETLDALTVEIEALGGEILYPSWQYKTIRARIDLAAAETIASLPDVVFIQA
ncbi:MAG: hypothetical protein ACXVH0_04610, partial [Thermoanaerobaculia bacterium]